MAKEIPDDLALIHERLIKAFNHPTRVHALTVCTQRRASPKEIAAELGQEINKVSYHINELVKLNCLELVETKKRRNADEHFYTATVSPFVDAKTWKRIPKPDRIKLRIDLIKLMSAEIEVAAGALTLDTADNHISRVALRLDRQGWEEIVSRLAETLEDVCQIKESAAIRLGESDEATIDTRVNIIHFEAPPPQQRAKTCSTRRGGRAHH